MKGFGGLTNTPSVNINPETGVKVRYSLKYMPPLMMENSVQLICIMGTITMEGNSFRPCTTKTVQSAACSVSRDLPVVAST